MQIRAGLAILDTPTLMLWAIIFLDVWLTEIALDANGWVGRCKFTGVKRGEATVQCWDLSVWFCLDPIMDWLNCCSTYICSLQDTADLNTLQIDIKNRFKNIIPPKKCQKTIRTIQNQKTQEVNGERSPERMLHHLKRTMNLEITLSRFLSQMLLGDSWIYLAKRLCSIRRYRTKKKH